MPRSAKKLGCRRPMKLNLLISMILKMTLNDDAARHERYKPADDTRSLRALAIRGHQRRVFCQALLRPTLSIFVPPTSSKACGTQFLRRMVHCTRFSRRLIFADEISRLMRYFATAKGAVPKVSYIAFVFRATNLICPTPKTSSSTFQAVAE